MDIGYGRSWTGRRAKAIKRPEIKIPKTWSSPEHYPVFSIIIDGSDMWSLRRGWNAWIHMNERKRKAIRKSTKILIDKMKK